MTHTLPKNIVKALNQENKLNGKINSIMVMTHLVMPKIKFMTVSKVKLRSKLEPTLKSLKMKCLKNLLRSKESVVPPR